MSLGSYHRLTADTIPPSMLGATEQATNSSHVARHESVVLQRVVITVDALRHLPDLQDVIFTDAGNDPFLVGVPRQL